MVPLPAGRPRRDAVHDELRRRLLQGEFPFGGRLTEIGLATELGTSRTPIREALLRLEAEGLVERRSDRGFYPRSPNLVGVRHLYELRGILEVQALQIPARHGRRHDADLIAAVRKEWTALADDPPPPDADFVVIDESFHVRIAEAAGNPALVEHLIAVNDRIRIVRMQNFIHADRIKVTIKQHLAILGALAKGNITATTKLFEAHLAEASGQAEERAAQALERMLTAGAVLTSAPVPR